MSWRAKPTDPARDGSRRSRRTAGRARTARSGFRAFRDELRREWPPGTAPVVVRTVDSTNALARRALESGSDAPPAARTFVAWGQTAGRGRRGRSWASPPGRGVYASVLTPLRSRGSLELLPLLGPLVLCQALRSAGVAGCGIKWPNDLVTENRKLGGLLIEAVSAAGGPRAAVIGFGVNYRAPSRSELATPAIGLADLVRPLPTLATVVRRLLEPLLDRLATVETERASDLAAAYRALSVHRVGERLACRTAAGTLAGEFAGFDDRGRLRLAVGAGERLISAGEIVEPA